MIVCGFLAAVGLGVVLDLLEHREELLEVFDLLEVDRDEQLLNDDLLAGAALAGASALGAFLLAASACEVDLLDGLAFERSLRAVEPLLDCLVGCILRQLEAVERGQLPQAEAQQLSLFDSVG